MKAVLMGKGVIVGASAPMGVQGAEYVKKLKLGNFILTGIPLDFNEALALAVYCRKSKTYLMFAEWLFRGSLDLLMCCARKKIGRSEFFSKEQINEILEAAGEYYIGRMTLGESGGMLYWPKEYIKDRASKNYTYLPHAGTVDKAKDEYVSLLRKTLDYERAEIGGGMLWDVDSSMTFKYHAEAGFDGFVIESMPGDNNFLYSAIRGASRGCRKPWGAHIAMACYGGSNIIDGLWLNRWKTSLYYSYIAGAGFIYPESGYYTFSKYTYDSAEMKEARRILREFNRFCNVHSRPAGGPEVKIAFAHGNLDGHPGLWNKYVWGQYENGDKWLHGPAEKSWNFVDKIYRKEDWSNSQVHGESDFSGHPAGGLYDVFPVESPIEEWKRYQCIIFLGWNTMTEEIYEKLKNYVSSGGHLIMAVPHLNMETDRGKELRIFRDGNLEELFGLLVKGKGEKAVNGVGYVNDSTISSYVFSKWACDPRFIGNFTPALVEIKGGKVIGGIRNFHGATMEEIKDRPLLVENSLGKGKAFLVTTWSWPGDEGMLEFFNDILRAVFAGELSRIMINGSDRIRHAIYDESGIKTVYLLNTDLGNTSIASLWLDGSKIAELPIAAADMRIVFVSKHLAIIPEDKCTEIKFWRSSDEKAADDIEMALLKTQKITFVNLTRKERILTLNGRFIQCQPGQIVLDVEKRIDLDSKEYYADDFLAEPELIWNGSGLPY